MAEVRWFGHACFELKGKTRSVVFDPFKGIGLPEPRIKADVVLCSHSHSDHNNARAVSHENSIVIEAFTGTRQIDNISIKGVATFHDEAQGGKRGRNSAYIVDLDDLTFCHLGDLGHELSSSQIREIGSVDVLFVPVGGVYTIGPDQARNVMGSLKPSITVPMHYRVPGMSTTFSSLCTLDDFLRDDDNVKKLDGANFTVTKADLREQGLIMIPELG